MRAEQDRLKAIILVARVRQFSAILLIILVVGLSLLGCKRSLRRSPAPSPVPHAMATSTSTAVSAATSTSAAVSAATATLAAATAEPTITPCGPPTTGWVPYTVQAGDTLSKLALSAGVSPEDVMLANCLESEDLSAGQVLYLPPLPTPTPCGPPPAGWTPYTVQAGDTLYRLALAAGVGQERVMQANCLESADLTVGQILHLPPLPTPTPTPCVPSPPAGWTLYTVRPGDTLFALATVRGTSTSDVVRVNCLGRSSILAGQRLYLPPLPVAYQPPTPVPTEPSSMFDPTPGPSAIPTTVWDSPVPNFPGYTPCESQDEGDGVSDPWISTPTEIRPGDNRNDLKLGWRGYYFACAFGSPDNLTATMTDPQGSTQPITPVLELTALLIPGLDTGQAQRAVIWNAICDLPTGPYVLTMDDGHGDMAELAFHVRESSLQEILAIPRATIPGRTFEIYYCGYEKVAGEEVEIDLYYEAGTQPDGRVALEHAAAWTVTINAEGWAREELPSLATDPARVYRILDRGDALKGMETIWLVQLP